MEKGVQKRSTLASGISIKSGFSLLEIVIVVGVIAILMTVAITQFRPGTSPISQFVEDVQRVAKTAQLASLQTHETHRIILSLQDQRMYIEQAQDPAASNQQAEQIFVAAPSPWDATAQIPDALTFTAVYVNGADELAGGITKRIWIYCYPSGMIQSTQLMVENVNTGMQSNITINPITAEVSRDEAAEQAA